MFKPADMTLSFQQHLVTNQIEKLLINCGLSMWSFVCGFSGGLMADIAGRRTLFLVSTAGMFFAFILQTICSAEFAVNGTKGAGSAVVAWICASFLLRYSGR